MNEQKEVYIVACKEFGGDCYQFHAYFYDSEEQAEEAALEMRRTGRALTIRGTITGEYEGESI